VHINSVNDASISCKNFVNFGPELTELINFWSESNISEPIFAIFSPYESALGAGDRFVPYFPICQGTLPWQPNNVWTNEKVMNAD